MGNARRARGRRPREAWSCHTVRDGGWSGRPTMTGAWSVSRVRRRPKGSVRAIDTSTAVLERRGPRRSDRPMLGGWEDARRSETGRPDMRPVAGGEAAEAVLADGLHRLDARLLAVVDEEERRALSLAPDGAGGWEGVRNLVRPPVASLTTPADPWDPLVPAGPSPLRRLADRFVLEDVELEAVLVALAGHVEPRYQAVYGLLQDDVHQPLPTERLLVAVLGREPGRMAALAESLGPGGRLTRSGVLQVVATPAAPLGRAFDLPGDVVTALLGGSRPPVSGAASQRWVQGTRTEVERRRCRRRGPRRRRPRRTGAGPPARTGGPGPPGPDDLRGRPDGVAGRRAFGRRPRDRSRRHRRPGPRRRARRRARPGPRAAEPCCSRASRCRSPLPTSRRPRRPGPNGAPRGSGRPAAP